MPRRVNAENMIPAGALQAAIHAMLPYVPQVQRDNALAAALAHSIGYGYPEAKKG